MTSRLKPAARLHWYHKRLFVRVWTKHQEWANAHFNYELWEIIEEWFVFFGFNPKLHGWFRVEESYYDGHTISSITVCGLVMGKGYTYQSQAVKE